MFDNFVKPIIVIARSGATSQSHYNAITTQTTFARNDINISPLPTGNKANQRGTSCVSLLPEHSGSEGQREGAITEILKRVQDDGNNSLALRERVSRSDGRGGNFLFYHKASNSAIFIKSVLGLRPVQISSAAAACPINISTPFTVL